MKQQQFTYCVLINNCGFNGCCLKTTKLYQSLKISVLRQIETRPPWERGRIAFTISGKVQFYSATEILTLWIPYFLLALAQKVWRLAGRDPTTLIVPFTTSNTVETRPDDLD